MKAVSLAAGLSVLVFAGCTHLDAPPPEVSWQERLLTLEGQTVTTEGFVADAKLGPFVEADPGKDSFYLDGYDSWPAECYDSWGRAKRVRVTGTVVKRTDIPVFDRLTDPHNPNDSRTWRFLLKDATITVMEELTATASPWLALPAPAPKD